MSGHLFLAVFVADANPDADDADEVADRLVGRINGGRTTANAEVMVSGIPAPQWLTPASLATLRANANAKPTPTPHPLAIDLVEFIDDLPLDQRTMIAHVMCCAPCRQSVFNIIQSAQGWPDLYGGGQ